jgi:VWFA-related protein
MTWTTTLRLASIAVLGSLFLFRAEARPRAVPQAKPPEFRADTAVVMLDVIARDRKGRPVVDLRPDELQVSENGQRCEIRSFAFVESERRLELAEPPGPSTVAPPPASEAATGAPLNLVSLVFDRLGLEDNRLAAKAARAFVEDGIAHRTRVAVFKIGTRLTLLQKFTSEKQLLLRAIEEATAGRDFRDRSLTADARRAEHEALVASSSSAGVGPLESGDASKPTGERVTGGRSRQPGQDLEEAGPEAKTREWIANALRMADTLQRQLDGQLSLYPLLALVKAQQAWPGRKTLVFFSPGLQVPANLDDVFRMIVSEVNRSNVSVYSVDARGLQARADITASGDAVRQAAMSSMAQQMGGRTEATVLGSMHALNTGEEGLRLNLQQTLGDLAEGTGGFLVANANDFAPAVDRLAADIRGYYAITYTPPVAAFDGSYRRIEVKVSRKDIALQSRRGYFALPPSDEIVLPYEMPLLAALSSSAARVDFVHYAAALSFTPGPDGTQVTVLLEVPLTGLDFVVDRKTNTFSLRLASLAMIKDAGGHVVERFSDDYPLGGPVEKLDAVRASNAVLRRSLRLAPGSYSLETASHLQRTGRTSVHRANFEISTPGPGPQMSSLCILRRADPLPVDAPATDDPFRIEKARLVPHLGGPLSRAATPNLSFFARVYPVPGNEPARLRLEFVRDGRVVGRAEPPLPSADASGRIAYLGGVPSSSLQPGAYEARLTLLQGTAQTTQSTPFDLLP